MWRPYKGFPILDLESKSILADFYLLTQAYASQILPGSTFSCKWSFKSCFLFLTHSFTSLNYFNCKSYLPMIDLSAFIFFLFLILISLLYCNDYNKPYKDYYPDKSLEPNIWFLIQPSISPFFLVYPYG